MKWLTEFSVNVQNGYMEPQYTAWHICELMKLLVSVVRIVFYMDCLSRM